MNETEDDGLEQKKTFCTIYSYCIISFVILRQGFMTQAAKV